MTLTRWTLAGVAIGAVTVVACATMQVSSFVERGADVTKYRTYAWAPAEDQATGDPRLDNNTFFRDRLQAQVDRRLDDRGFEKTPGVGPDLIVHYHASVTQEINAAGLDRPNVTCEDCRPYVYDAGTIVVDLVDARTNRLVWRGWAEGTLEGAIDNQAFMERRIDEAVAQIIERLPRRL